MKYILELLRGYYPEIDKEQKIITIRKPIDVPFFVYIKNLIKKNTDYKEIRVETIRSKNERGF